MTRADQIAADVSACSAAQLWNVIDQIVKLPSVEGFTRLEGFFEAALTAFRDGLRNWYETPSNN